MKNDWKDPYKVKIDYSLAPPEFDDVILVLQQAAESGKYGRDDWLKGINFDSEKNYSSSMRHWRDKRKGVTKDKDSGLHPLLHVACRALMDYTLYKREEQKVFGVVQEAELSECYGQAAKEGGTVWHTVHPQYCECNVCSTYRSFGG
jgi:hypothetical protein